MERGTWIKIDSMEGEPRMTGRCGKFDHYDSMGQMQGSWGIAIQPEHDCFHEMSQAEIDEYLASKGRK